MSQSRSYQYLLEVFWKCYLMCCFSWIDQVQFYFYFRYPAQKMKFSIEDFFSKCDQIRRKLRIWSHLLEKYLMETFIFLCSDIPTSLNQKLGIFPIQNYGHLLGYVDCIFLKCFLPSLNFLLKNYFKAVSVDRMFWSFLKQVMYHICSNT